MDKTSSESLLGRLTPRTIESDPTVQAINRVLTPYLTQAVENQQRLLVLHAIDSLGETELDHLGWQWASYIYHDTWDVETKRDFLKNLIPQLRHMGTMQAIKDVLSTFATGVYVFEWFEEGGTGVPYTFRIVIDLKELGEVTTAELIEDVYRTLDITKNVRSVFSVTISQTLEIDDAHIIATANTVVYGRGGSYDPRLEAMLDGSMWVAGTAVTAAFGHTVDEPDSEGDMEHPLRVASAASTVVSSRGMDDPDSEGVLERGVSAASAAVGTVQARTHSELGLTAEDFEGAVEGGMHAFSALASVSMGRVSSVWDDDVSVPEAEAEPEAEPETETETEREIVDAEASMEVNSAQASSSMVMGRTMSDTDSLSSAEASMEVSAAQASSTVTFSRLTQ